MSKNIALPGDLQFISLADIFQILGEIIVAIKTDFQL